MKAAQFNLTNQSFSQINEQDRIYRRANNAQTTTITITGKFSIVKHWNAQQVRKEVVEGGMEVKDAKVVTAKQQWCTIEVNGETYFVNITEAKATVKIAA